jgi:hypothetical protein
MIDPFQKGIRTPSIPNYEQLFLGRATVLTRSIKDICYQGGQRGQRTKSRHWSKHYYRVVKYKTFITLEECLTSTLLQI